MTKIDEAAITRIKAMSAEFHQITGHDAYLHTSDIGITFTDAVVGSWNLAEKHMTDLLTVAREGRADTDLWW